MMVESFRSPLLLGHLDFSADYSLFSKGSPTKFYFSADKQPANHTRYISIIDGFKMLIFHETLFFLLVNPTGFISLQIVLICLSCITIFLMWLGKARELGTGLALETKALPLWYWI